MTMIKLDNGEMLFNHFGKYASGLTFLMKNEEDYNYIPISQQELNVDNGNFSIIKGDFFTSKKGTKCFRIKQNGNDVLIRDNWGGSFNRYTGRTLFQIKNLLFEKRASSNGGGTGYDFIIISKKDFLELPTKGKSIDDI